MEALSGWHQTLNRWHYYEDGTPLTGWQNVDDNWYYFDQTGVPQFGWLSDEDNWYYFLENGTMARDQELTFGSWTTRFDENGHWIPAE
jgi:glucan-binding YG repeat protein